jgi:outer membrane lipoprotein SlyB
MLAGCATSADGVAVVPGEVVAVRAGEVKPPSSGLGAATGVALGGAAAAGMVGGSPEEVIIGAIFLPILGMVAGGAAGEAAERAMPAQPGHLYAVRLTDGRTVEVGSLTPTVAPVGATVCVALSTPPQLSDVGC